MSSGSSNGDQLDQPQFLLVQNNNIIEKVVQSSIGKSSSFAYRSPQIDYGIDQDPDGLQLQLQEDSDGGGSTSSGAGGGDRSYLEEDHPQSSKSSSGQQKRTGLVMDDKKMRRQIANSNERRRMQSINAGFQSLRNLLPHHEGEKLSKAAILQQTAEYIYTLEQEKTQLLSQCCYLKRLLAQNDVAQELQQDEILTLEASPSAGGAAPGNAVALVPSSTTIIPGAAGAVTTTITTNNTTSSGTNTSSLGGGQGPIAGGGAAAAATAATAAATGPNKKRKMMDAVTTIQAVSDSSDEGLGSMSPEPFTIVLTGKTKKQQAAALAAAADLKQQQQQQHQPTYVTSNGETYMVTEVIRGGQVVGSQTEIVEPCVDFEIDIDSTAIEEVSERSVPTSAAPLPKKKRHTVESVDSELEGQAGVTVVNRQIKKIFQDLSEPQPDGLHMMSYDSDIVMCSAFPTDAAVTYEVASTEMHPTTTIIGKIGKAKVAIIEAKESAATAASDKKSKLQPLLESFNKVENKVEVERISSSPLSLAVKEEPGVVVAKTAAGARAFLGTSTSRQNLETIVEAIRHLEGDHMFGGENAAGAKGVVVKTERLAGATILVTASAADLPTQEVPLALTTKSMQAEMSPFLQFRTTSGSATTAGSAANSSSAATVGNSGSSSSGSALPKVVTVTTTPSVVLHQLQQCRPGVIVAKQNS